MKGDAAQGAYSHSNTDTERGRGGRIDDGGWWWWWRFTVSTAAGGAERIADVLVENLEVDTGREALSGLHSGGEHSTAQPPSCQKSSTSG